MVDGLVGSHYVPRMDLFLENLPVYLVILFLTPWGWAFWLALALGTGWWMNRKRIKEGRPTFPRRP